MESSRQSHGDQRLMAGWSLLLMLSLCAAPALGWVLMSPFSRGNAGLAGSSLTAGSSAGGDVGGDGCMPWLTVLDASDCGLTGGLPAWLASALMTSHLAVLRLDGNDFDAPPQWRVARWICWLQVYCPALRHDVVQAVAL